jgi:hypothetical protein
LGALFTALLAVAVAQAPADGGADEAPEPSAVEAAPAVVEAAQSEDDCHPVTVDGQPFATCFDAGKGLELSGYGGLDGLNASSTFTLSVRMRGARDSQSKRGTIWFDDHRGFITSFRPGATDRSFSITAWEGLFRRHVPEGFLMLPTNPPFKIPFPLDIGLAFTGTRFEYLWGGGWAVQAARVTLFFDAVRSPTARFHLGLGPTLAYTIRGGVGSAITHELMPLTGLQGLAAFESANGRWALHASGVAGWTFEPGQSQGTFRARGELVGERVVLALNNQPISVSLKATAAFRDLGGTATSEWTVQAGLSLRLFSSQ